MSSGCPTKLRADGVSAPFPSSSPGYRNPLAPGVTRGAGPVPPLSRSLGAGLAPQSNEPQRVPAVDLRAAGVCLPEGEGERNMRLGAISAAAPALL